MASETTKSKTKEENVLNTSSVMEKLLARKGSVLSFSPGDRVEATVLRTEGKSIVFDIGGKGEALVTGKSYDAVKEFARKLDPGDKVMVTVAVPENSDGVSLVSLRETAMEQSWREVKEVMKANKSVFGMVKNTNPAGLVVQVLGLEGFVPSSQILKENVGDGRDLVGNRVELKIMDADPKEGQLILSEKAVVESAGLKAAQKILGGVAVGDVYKGVVTSVTSFGAFVELMVGRKKIEGLVHLSELSWEKVNDPADFVSAGDKVEVKVIGKDRGKLALSIKQAKGDPWDKVEEKYKPGAAIKGKVMRKTDFGVFVQLEPGVEGLIHLTKIPPATQLKSGEEISCTIEEVDRKLRKISLDLALSAKPVGYK